MKPLSPAAVLTGVLLSVAADTGCAAAAKHAEPSAAAPSAVGACPTTASLPLPKDFPETLPVPDGAVVTSVEHRTGDRLVVATVVRGGFDAALAFPQKRLPKAGYALKEGEVEDDDAESDFSSMTVEGRWTLRKMPDAREGCT